ncbi:tlde1 domain-containing protein [Caballeronia sp. EK]|uniref:tlde1 domain-containing protein n=1 Tax=Caballeronia sp. EK TaxID=2767469 RepID=UPI0035C90B28
MTVRCTFTLNNRSRSTLACDGYGTLEVFSGQKEGQDNLAAIVKPEFGPIPPGTYYLVNRSSRGGGAARQIEGRYWIDRHWPNSHRVGVEPLQRLLLPLPSL